MAYRKIYNLERDIKSTGWFVDRVKNDEVYAQNLYAAFCNHEFVPADVWGILSNIRWSCPWRYAATIVADIRDEPNDIWYCSGIQLINPNYVEESVVVPEIEESFKIIGWIVEDIE